MMSYLQRAITFSWYYCDMQSVLSVFADEAECLSLLLWVVTPSHISDRSQQRMLQCSWTMSQMPMQCTIAAGKKSSVHSIAWHAMCCWCVRIGVCKDTVCYCEGFTFIYQSYDVVPGMYMRLVQVIQLPQLIICYGNYGNSSNSPKHMSCENLVVVAIYSNEDWNDTCQSAV